MRNLTRQELEVEVIHLRARLKAVEHELDRVKVSCDLLRVQNDYLQELLSPASEEDNADRDTVPAKPHLNDGPITKPSSPTAIKLDELAIALEASDTTRREREEGRFVECPICNRTDEHAHEIIINDSDPSGKLN